MAVPLGAFGPAGTPRSAGLGGRLALAKTGLSPAMAVDWAALEQIRELAPWFGREGARFRQEIEHDLIPLQAIGPQDLENLALLRVLEVTNGCAQWGFRRQDPGCLSADQARDCMRQVIGFIKDKRLVLPRGGTVGFSPARLLRRFHGPVHRLWSRAIEGGHGLGEPGV